MPVAEITGIDRRAVAIFLILEFELGVVADRRERCAAEIVGQVERRREALVAQAAIVIEVALVELLVGVEIPRQRRRLVGGEIRLAVGIIGIGYTAIGALAVLGVAVVADRDPRGQAVRQISLELAANTCEILRIGCLAARHPVKKPAVGRFHPARNAEPDPIRERAAGGRFGPHIVITGIAHFGIARPRFAGAYRDEVGQAAARGATKQRTLRAAQHFNALQIVHGERRRVGRAQIDFV